jgi:glycosyltransferase involved in cell wall biosynthesis
MKVIQVLNHFLPHQTAGTEVYTWALSKQLQKFGVNLQVLIPHYGQTFGASYVYDGLSVHQYAEPSVVDRSLIMGFRESDGLKHFTDYLRVTKPDIIHFHELAGSNGITLKHVQAAKAFGSKVIMTFHLARYSCKTGTLVYKGEDLCDGLINLHKCSNCYLRTRSYLSVALPLTLVSAMLDQLSIDTSNWNSKIGTALGTLPIIAKQKNDLNALVASCDTIVTITNWYKRQLLANGVNEDKISFIPQGLPFKANIVLVKNKVNHKPLHLIFLGRINKFKGLHLLISAIDGINPSLINLSIFGNSDDLAYETNLRTKTSEMSNVFWKGKLTQEEVVSTINRHDMLCLCSTFSEMSPLVIQEAFAAGIPVLASDVYGNAEQIKHGHNGLLFQFNNVADLRSKLLRCIEDPSLLENLSKNIKPPRSFEEVGQDYFTLYKSLLD